MSRVTSSNGTSTTTIDVVSKREEKVAASRTSGPVSPATTASDHTQPVTLSKLVEMKENKQPIVMVTAYDYPSALVVERAGVDIVLVGDSGAQTVLGYNSTVPVSVDELLMLCSAVRRGLKTPLLVGDLPFGSYEVSDRQAVRTAIRFVKEAGCGVVKLERGGQSAERARAIVQAGIPVMGHIGLTPQTATALGGLRAQGRQPDQAAHLLEDLERLQDAGCFAIVLEAIPTAVTNLLLEYAAIPTIGIGSGPNTDGQVLVFHDLLGMTSGCLPRFAKRWAEIGDEMIAAVTAYAAEVRSGEFPGMEHGFKVPADQLDRIKERLEGQGYKRAA